eukprot:GDKI01014040.1.p1 GENE.GDKI01014040.1~~GDKI01014040.1.p1  ORF type:complete len:366 (-),score=83.03 GDKI01014040.1:203-1300(-)
MSLSYDIRDLSLSSPDEASNSLLAAAAKPPPDPILIMVVVIVAFVFIAAVSCCSTTNQMRRVMRTLPLVRPSEMGNHVGKAVKVVGRIAHNGKLLAAPFSGKPCVAYQVHVSVTEKRKEQRRDREGKMHTHTRSTTIATEQNSTEFLLLDTCESGAVFAVCWIPGTGVTNKWGNFDAGFRMTLMCVKDEFERSGLFSNATPYCEAFLRRHGTSSTGLRNLTYKEGSLLCGEVIAVCGMVKQITAPNGNLVYTLAPLNQTQIDTENFSCLESGALEDLDGTLLVTDDRDIMGGDMETAWLEHTPNPIQNTSLPPTNPETEYFSAHTVPSPAYAVHLSDRTRAYPYADPLPPHLQASAPPHDGYSRM